MTDSERFALLRDLALLEPAAEHTPDPTRWFLPLPAHETALRADTLVVRGERGAGKTSLFAFVNAVDTPTLARLFPSAHVAGTTWIDGFSKGMTHPHVDVLEHYGRDASPSDLRNVWLVNLVRVVAHDPALRLGFPEALEVLLDETPQDPRRWVHIASEHMPRLAAYLDAVERRLEAEGRTVIVVYDYLDQIGALSESGVRASFTGALLAMWSSLSGRYRFLRGKVFVREDLFAAAKRAFPDASKLESRSVSLSWSNESLYRMLIRRVTSQSDALRAWIEVAIPLKRDALLGYLPPDTLPETGDVSQKAFADRLAGETMGIGLRKGYTYRWIVNRLQDAHGRVVPRSLVNLIGIAARIMIDHGPETTPADQLLSTRALMAALEETSRRRAGELGEEHEVVQRMNALEGITVLLDREAVIRMLDADRGDGEAVFRELIQLGILALRSDGRVDVPDIYRFGYGIKRKGGVARPR